jgi:hypothetical protein
MKLEVNLKSNLNMKLTRTGHSLKKQASKVGRGIGYVQIAIVSVFSGAERNDVRVLSVIRRQMRVVLLLVFVNVESERACP